MEPGNVRRGGWSSVVRISGADGLAFYLKRQEDHDFIDWRGGFRRQPTVVREWTVAQDFQQMGLRPAEPVCLGVNRGNKSQGLLVTVALDDYQPLGEVLRCEGVQGAVRQTLWTALADVVRKFHDEGYRHNCLYGQHLYVKQVEGGWDIRLIDLEKATRTRRRKRATVSDLSALDRHTDDMSHRDRRWFWDRYFAGVSLDQRRPLLRRIARRTSVRLVDQYLRDCRSRLQD